MEIGGSGLMFQLERAGIREMQLEQQIGALVEENRILRAAVGDGGNPADPWPTRSDLV